MYCIVPCCNYRMIHYGTVYKIVPYGPPVLHHYVSSCSYNKGQYSTSESIAWSASHSYLSSVSILNYQYLYSLGYAISYKYNDVRVVFIEHEGKKQ